MFAKKDVIYSSTMGLCLVADVTKLSADRGTPILYYVLNQFYDRTKVAYIPVENHEVELRNVIDSESANEELVSLAQKGTDNSLPDAEILDMRVGELAYVLKTPYATIMNAIRPEIEES